MLRTAFHLDGKLGGYGSYFNREWCTVVDEVAADLDVVRYWDLAAIPIGRFGIKLGRDRNGGYWLLDLARGPADPGDVDRLLLNTATQDGKQVRIGLARIRDRPARARRCTWARAQWLYRNTGKPNSHARQRDRSTASLRFMTAGVTRSSLCSVPPAFSTEDFVTHCLVFRA